MITINNITSDDAKTAFTGMFGNKESTDFTTNGKCSHCGSCCALYLPITEPEINQIKNYVKRHGVKPSMHKTTDEPIADMVCPFLRIAKTSTQCSIYPVRPKICKAYICNADPMELARQMMFEEAKTFDINDTSIPENRNIAQVVYPEKYLPKKGDTVIAGPAFENMPDSKIKPGDAFTVEQDVTLLRFGVRPGQHVMLIRSIADPNISATVDIEMFIRIM